VKLQTEGTATVGEPRVGSELLGGSQPVTVRLGRIDPVLRRRVLRWGAALVVVAFLAVEGVAVWQLRRDGESLQRTRATAAARSEDLGQAEGRLRRTRDELGAASQELTDVRTRLRGLQDDLGARSAERAKLVDALAVALDDLTATSEELGTTEQRLSAQLDEVQALRSCLTGVSQALTLVTFDDDARALAALDGVEGSCARAEASLALRRGG
jgi:hypothetical protein